MHVITDEEIAVNPDRPVLCICQHVINVEAAQVGCPYCEGKGIVRAGFAAGRHWPTMAAECPACHVEARICVVGDKCENCGYTVERPSHVEQINAALATAAEMAKDPDVHGVVVLLLRGPGAAAQSAFLSTNNDPREIASALFNALSVVESAIYGCDGDCGDCDGEQHESDAENLN